MSIKVVMVFVLSLVVIGPVHWLLGTCFLRLCIITALSIITDCLTLYYIAFNVSARTLIIQEIQGGLTKIRIKRR